ncbi:MAG: hypothetical protein RIS85_2690 [Pseudomonadota bacterium]
MFGPRLGTVFASRWRALWWAASIMALAWSVVPSADDSAAEQPHAHVDPWAKAQKDSAN